MGVEVGEVFVLDIYMYIYKTSYFGHVGMWGYIRCFQQLFSVRLASYTSIKLLQSANLDLLWGLSRALGIEKLYLGFESVYFLG